jgi:hypothetical protein
MQTPSNCYYLLFNFHILVCISKNKHNRIYHKIFCSMNPRYFQSVIECNHFILAFLLNFYRMGIFLWHIIIALFTYCMMIIAYKQGLFVLKVIILDANITSLYWSNITLPLQHLIRYFIGTIRSNLFIHLDF